jgi:hypothetical protein
MEAGLGGNRAMYGYAQSLLKSGEVKNAEKGRAMMQTLSKSKTDDFWKKMAMETIANDSTNAKEGMKQ